MGTPKKVPLNFGKPPYFCDAQAAVPLTVGTRLGRPLAVGIELQPDSDEGLTSADMQCGFCIGVTWQRKLQ